MARREEATAGAVVEIVVVLYVFMISSDFPHVTIKCEAARGGASLAHMDVRHYIRAPHWITIAS